MSTRHILTVLSSPPEASESSLGWKAIARTASRWLPKVVSSSPHEDIPTFRNQSAVPIKLNNSREESLGG